MDIELNEVEAILFLGKDPKNYAHYPEAWFLEKIKLIKAEKLRYPIQYLPELMKMIHPITHYYQLQIDRDVIKYYNELNHLVAFMEEDKDQAYLVYVALNKYLHDKLNQVAEHMKQLSGSYIDLIPGKGENIADLQQQNEIFIYEYLKLSLVVLYINIQEKFKTLLENPLSEADLFRIYFNESTPDFTYKKQAPAYQPPLKKTEEKVVFIPLSEDRNSYGLKMNFQHISNPRLFHRVEEQLYEYGIIDLNSRFIKSKKNAHQQLLAAVYREMIDRNYFRRNIIGSKQKLKDTDIVRYLDARYMTDTSQAFRKLTEAQKQKAYMKLPWLEGLVGC